MRWQKKLTKKQYRHLQEVFGPRPTLRAFKEGRAYQLKKRAESRVWIGDLCWTCWEIAHRLGMEEPE